MDERSDSGCDLICFSGARWSDVWGRTQQLLSRAAADRRVFFFEPPIPGDGQPHLSMRRTVEGVIAMHPVLPACTPPSCEPMLLRQLVDHLIAHQHLTRYSLWFDTPIALAFAAHLEPMAAVYDCAQDRGDEPDAWGALEDMLLDVADVVFTADPSLAQAKRVRHANVHAFPGPDDPRFVRVRPPRSWDSTWREMDALLDEAIAARLDDDDGLARYAASRTHAELMHAAY